MEKIRAAKVQLEELDDRQELSQTKRLNIIFHLNVLKMSLTEIADITGINYSTIRTIA